MARSALFVSCSTYADTGLAQLPSAARDAVELGELFADPGIGPFTVAALESPPAQEMRLALEDLFAEATPDDTVVLYLSGHGLKDPQGNLYFAAHDTRPNRLQSTAVSAQLLCSLLNGSRAEGVVVFLDCCYGGAFARGMVARADGDPHVGDAFAALGAGARSRAVITASSAIEYAFEGERLADAHVQPSVFASAMRDGLASGEADRDGDGWVGLSELFEYIRQRIQRAGQPQTPHLWTFGASGDLRVTRSPRGPRASVSALPAEIRELLTSPVPAARLGAATDLRDRAVSPDLPMARAAVAALVQLTEDDSLRVRAAAVAGLAACSPRIEPAELRARAGETVRARVSGPPVTLADALVESPPEGVVATVTGNELAVDVRRSAAPGTLELRLRWTGGSVPVSLVIEHQPTAAAPGAEEHGSAGPVQPTEPEPVALEAAEPATRSKAEQATQPTAEPVTPPKAKPKAKPSRPPDDPAWLLAAGVFWLLSGFLPVYGPSSYGITMAYWLDRHIPGTVLLIAGAVLAGIGLYRLRISRDPITLGIALLLLLGTQFVTAWVVGVIANDNEGIGSGLLLALLTAASGLVYASRVMHRVGGGGWLIGAGVVWLVALLLPMNSNSGFDLLPVIEAFEEVPALAVLLLLGGTGAIGAGLARLRPAWRDRRVPEAVAVTFAVLMVVQAIGLMIVTVRNEDVFGPAAVLALEPLAFALVYLVQAGFALTRRRRG